MMEEAKAAIYKFWEKKMGFSCLVMISSRGEFRNELGYGARELEE